MKGNGIERDTLDGVITALERVDDTWQNVRNSLQYPDLRDALHYLKEYKKDRENPDGDHQQLEKARALLQEFFANPPLTWDELKTMEGKPVWVEWTKTEESYWCFVGEWFDDDEMRIYHIGRDYADYIHKTIYTPDIVQAYKKERK